MHDVDLYQRHAENTWREGDTRTEAVDENGDGSTNFTRTHVIVVNGDGSRSETTTIRNADNSLREKHVETISTDSQTRSIDIDADGDGAFEVTRHIDLVVNVDGSTTSSVDRG